MTDIYLTISLYTHNGDDTPQSFVQRYADKESQVLRLVHFSASLVAT